MAWRDYPIDISDYKDKAAIARSMVLPSIVRRKSDQQVNIVLIMSSLGVAGLILFGYFMLLRAGGLQLQERDQHNQETRTALDIKYFGVSTKGVPVIEWQTPGAVETLTLIPTETYTPTKNVLRYETSTPNFPALTNTPQVLKFEAAKIYIFSFYNPNMLVKGEVVNGKCNPDNIEGKWCHTTNCWDYSPQEGQCISLMASGHKYQDYWNKALP